MTFFIEKLSKEEEKEILEMLGFIDNEKTKYNESTFAGYKVFTKIKSTRLGEEESKEIIYLSDFDVRVSLNKKINLKVFYGFMFEKFGVRWAEKGLSSLNGKKSIRKKEYIRELITKRQVATVVNE